MLEQRALTNTINQLLEAPIISASLVDLSRRVGFYKASELQARVGVE